VDVFWHNKSFLISSFSTFCLYDCIATLSKTPCQQKTISLHSNSQTEENKNHLVCGAMRFFQKFPFHSKCTANVGRVFMNFVIFWGNILFLTAGGMEDEVFTKYESRFGGYSRNLRWISVLAGATQKIRQFYLQMK